MTVASALTALNQDIVNARTAITNKGGTVTTNGGSSQLATDIATIPTGSAPVITSLSVTPTTSAQTITAPSGTDGYSPVNVAAVTASIDSNITAGNIKKDVQILGVTGTYEGSGGGGGGSERAFTANFWVDTSGVVHNFIDTNNTTLSATATQIGVNSFSDKYKQNNTIDLVDFSNIESAGVGCFSLCFAGSSVSKADFSNIKYLTGQQYSEDSRFNSCFISCPNLISIDISSLEYAGEDCFTNFCNNCPNLISVNISGLKRIYGENTFRQAFRNTAISKLEFENLSDLTDANTSLQYILRGVITQPHIYFNSLTTNSFMSSSFYRIVGGVDTATIHLPSNLQSTVATLDGYPLFGGTNTVLSFDLPATS